ncbi:MAG TPA: mechanosensitive ion channel family protein [Vicinamibacterales bacterium]|nr:mechanosensitive ion channel family protein [Vicinamibacterales bacterium]
MRGRLFGSAIVFAVFVLAAALVTYAPLTPRFRGEIVTFSPLLLAWGLINAIIALAINPWRADRLPDRFPNIVQDALVIALFALAATVVLQDKIVATTAVGAVVVGLALQDTLGNLFAGLAIQIEKPFRVGHWVRIADKDGLVSEITWRATKIRTKSGNLVIVPNNALARDTVTNYSEPFRDTRLEVDVGAPYETPPHEVKSAILDALRHEPMVSHERQPDVLLVDFAPSAVTYRVLVWTSEFDRDEWVKDRVRWLIYYAFRRHGITIPYPTQVQIACDAGVLRPSSDAAAAAAAIDLVPIFAPLDSDTRALLAHQARAVTYAPGETVVKEGEPGSSMFVVVSGEAAVTLDPDGREVARFEDEGFFGEMSLLTGAPRTATVRAITNCELLEITAEAFRRFVLAHPAAVEQVAQATATRVRELARVRSAGGSVVDATEPQTTLIARIRRFLRLAS